MIKLLVFIRKLPGLTREQFISYYESNHAPLALRLFPMFASYRRNYLMQEFGTEPRDTEYDVVTEIVFASQEDLRRFHERCADPEILAAIRTDEANFLISSETRMFLVEQHSSISNAAPSPA